MHCAVFIVRVCCISIDEDDLHKVLNELIEISQVTSLGLSLGLRMSSIEGIKNDCQSSDEQKTIVVYRWLKRQDIVRDYQSCPPTWNQLALAVAKENPTVSRRIQEKYCTILS